MQTKAIVRFIFVILLAAVFLAGGWALVTPQVEASRLYACTDDFFCASYAGGQGCPSGTHCAWVTCPGSTYYSCGISGAAECVSSCDYLQCNYLCEAGF